MLRSCFVCFFNEVVGVDLVDSDYLGCYFAVSKLCNKKNAKWLQLGENSEGLC